MFVKKQSILKKEILFSVSKMPKCFSEPAWSGSGPNQIFEDSKGCYDHLCCNNLFATMKSRIAIIFVFKNLMANLGLLANGMAISTALWIRWYWKQNESHNESSESQNYCQCGRNWSCVPTCTVLGKNLCEKLKILNFCNIMNRYVKILTLFAVSKVCLRCALSGSDPNTCAPYAPTISRIIL